MNSLAGRRNIDLNLDLSTGNVYSSCNLELSLSTPGSFGSAADSNGGADKEEFGEDRKDLQQMWIVYNGNVCVCDATEVQARAILSQAAAAREAEETRTSSSPQPVSLSLPPQLQSSTGIAMKRSLQRFLEKRRVRIQSMKSLYQKQRSTTECQ